MLDCRSQGLHGLSATNRIGLTFAQVLQLYFCCYQQHFVREVMEKGCKRMESINLHFPKIAYSLA